MRQQVGTINKNVIDTLKLTMSEGAPIFLGDSNLSHMKSEHPNDFAKYGDKLGDILNYPDFVTLHPHNGSIDYIKFFDPDHVLVAVRVSANHVAYARTLFVMSDEKVAKYMKHGYMKSVT